MSTLPYLDQTLDTPAENLALDEALLDAAELGQGPDEVVRLWEPAAPFVVAGRSTRLQSEIHLDACRRDRTPVRRRSSGGASIVAGPGCLMYAVVLSCERRPRLRAIDQAHAHVLGLLAHALAEHVPTVEHRGTSDLVFAADSARLSSQNQPADRTNQTDAPRANRKFSGNSLRCKRTHLLYHGTLLFDFPLDLVGRYLAMPPRQPDYRDGRGHERFIANLPIARRTLRQTVLDALGADEETTSWPSDQVELLVQQRYSQPSWTEQFP